jgi:hypothetical protein
VPWVEIGNDGGNVECVESLLHGRKSIRDRDGVAEYAECRKVDGVDLTRFKYLEDRVVTKNDAVSTCKWNVCV